MNRTTLAASRDGAFENADVAARSEEILTIGGAATLCGVSRSTIRRAVALGQLRAWHTPGNHLRFSRAGCVEFAASLGQVDLVGRPTPEHLRAEPSVRVGAARA
jgi:excisionase family DNA binding protein